MLGSPGESYFPPSCGSKKSPCVLVTGVCRPYFTGQGHIFSLCHQHLTQGLAYSRYWTDVCWMKKCTNKCMHLLCGRHWEWSEDQSPNPDSDLQITFRWTLAPNPNDFLCAPGTHRSSCILAWFHPLYSHSSISTVSFLPGVGRTQLS